jgi:hypothetical protein
LECGGANRTKVQVPQYGCVVGKNARLQRRVHRERRGQRAEKADPSPANCAGSG